MSELKDLLVEDAPDAVDVFVAGGQGLDEAAAAIGGNAPAWIASSNYKPVPGSHLLVPGADGALAGVIAGAPSTGNPFAPLALGRLAAALPSGTYRLARPPEHADLAALGWLLGAYRFTSYHSGQDEEQAARLVMPQGGERAHVVRVAEGCHRTMDLVNLPANDLGPDALAQAVKQLAADFGASASETVGDDLIATNLPLIHAVGRAGTQAPRLVDFTWGDPSAPKVTLVGKGVTFDTGGLDLKPSSAMLLMKKDMGGAANVLGLAQMIMDAGLNLRLRVLVPIVENCVAGAAFRPGDVLTSRKGLTVEIGNTDAEGRLILADALSLGDEEEPELMVDMATLTGAARVALGPDLSPFYTHDDEVAAALAGHARSQADPLWRMPLWPRYDKWINGKVGDISNAPEKPMAGSITAALFLSRFVEKVHTHLHFDIYAWTPQSLPHAPHGGAAQAIRALFSLIGDRYGT